MKSLRICINAMMISLSLLALEVTTGERLTEKTAGREFSTLADQTIARLVIADTQIQHVHIGDSEELRELGYRSEQFEIDDYAFAQKGDRLYIVGGERGVLYGVFNFFEDLVGCRFWSSMEVDLPDKHEVNSPALPVPKHPFFELRELYRNALPKDGGRGAIARGLVREGHRKFSPEYGGESIYGPPDFCHTFDQIMPFDKYGEEHPEYFSYIDGIRIGGQNKGQLCLTNTEMRQEFLRLLLDNIRKAESQAEVNGNIAPAIYDVSQNDNQKYCRCEKCSEFAKTAGQSGLMLDFVNWLLVEVRKEFPQVKLQTFAYAYTFQPPQNDIRPLPGVIVRLCNTDSNQWLGASANAKFRKALANWASIADRVYVWDYAIIFWERVTGLPFPSEFHYPDTYRLYADNHVKGVFWEQEEVDIADMSDLKYYLHSKYMQDPYREDFEELFNGFMSDYYGAGGKYMAEYRRCLEQLAKRGRLQVRWFPQAIDFRYIDCDSMKYLQQLLATARNEVSDNPDLVFRINRSSMGLDRLAGYELPWFYAETGLDLEEIRSRFENTWNECERRGWIPKKKSEILAWLKQNVVYQSHIKPSPEFQGQIHVDFPGCTIERMLAMAEIKQDEQAQNGYATTITMPAEKTGQQPEKLNLAVGAYDYNAGENFARENITAIEPDGKYRWYDFPIGIVPDNPARIYLGKDWSAQISLGYVGPLDRSKPLRAHIRLKATVRQEGDGQEKNIFWVDRLVLTEDEVILVNP